MKKLITESLAIFALLLFCITIQSQNQKFHDYAGKFKINFPGNPTPGSQDLETDMGNVTLYQFMYETSNAVFMVSYVDYPSDQMESMDRKELLDKAKNGFNGALKIVTSDSMFINYGRHQGLLFHAEGSGLFCSMRDYMVDNRLYQLGILQMSAIEVETENNFFDSFELVK